MLVYNTNKKGRRKAVGFARPTRRRKPVPASPWNSLKTPIDDSPNLTQEQKKPLRKREKQHKASKNVALLPTNPIHREQPQRPIINDGPASSPPHLAPQPAWSLPLREQSRQPAVVDDSASIVSAKLDNVLTAIDQGAFSGREKDLTVDFLDLEYALQNQSRGLHPAISPPFAAPRKVRKGKALNPFSKVNFYINSRLPDNLPPIQLYLPAWPLVCLAAQYSERAYEKPKGEERQTHVTPDWKGQEKAMVIKSVPVDHMNVIAFAIRGTQSFSDWATNFNANSAAPTGFLDDPGNFCHAGFLNVARKMVSPVAARLRKLLEDNPARSSCSLVITGHSAGGAVAALLFCHMLSASISSELTSLATRFKRIHCITFGAPPVSGLPLLKPESIQHRKSLFMSFVNEGDPVTRADPAYIRSLLDLYMSPTPTRPAQRPTVNESVKPDGAWRYLKLALPKNFGHNLSSPDYKGPIWQVPPCSFSNAGRIVVLRAGATKKDDDICASTSTDQGLRGVVFGDPLMHMMRVYRERVELLASRAITGGAWTDQKRNK